MSSDFVDVSVALGKGIYSVGEDLVLGIHRTGESLGYGQNRRMAQIGQENWAITGLIIDAIKYGLYDEKGPLYRAIALILEEYYSYFPEKVLLYLAKKASMAIAYTAGRMIVGKKLAEVIAIRVVAAVATSATYKALATRLGVSARAGATRIGAPITVLMAQGVLQRSSFAAMRLKSKNPKLYSVLERNGNLQFLYFILEDPLEVYFNAIALAEDDIDQFQQIIDAEYKDKVK